jgi:hypothetical protein
MNAMSFIDIDSMTQNERLKLIQIGLTYVVPKLKHTVIHKGRRLLRFR